MQVAPVASRVIVTVTLTFLPLHPGEAQQNTSGPSPAAESVLMPVLHELEQLARFDETPRSRTELLRRNLSRYYAVNLVPTDTEEMNRLVGTAERMSRTAAIQIYRTAEQAARARGVTAIAAADVSSVVSLVLPSTPTPYNEIVFFPAAEAPVVLELADLVSFQDTGFCWEILAFLVESTIRPNPDALPMAADAVQTLGDAVNAYGLLLLRIGGMHARADFAPFLQSHHLRAAGKTIGQQASDLPADPWLAQAREIDSPWFTEVAEQVGLRFRHVSSDWVSEFRRYGSIAPTFSGGGVSAGHLDGDEQIDLVVCGGQGCKVFLNNGDATFRDATSDSGLGVDGEARMAVLADFDNDGRTDVFITYARDTNRLFRNVGAGHFADITDASGLAREGDISGPAVAVDYDNDGLLDLYVGNFGDYLGGAIPWSPNASMNGMPNRLYRNLGGFRFTDVTAAAGVGDTGWTQALSHVDYDLDGDQDLYIANDFGPNDLLINNGDGTFTSAGIASGSDDPFHGMNVAFADLNADHHADIFVTNIWFWNPTRDEIGESNSLLLSAVGADGSVSYRRLEDPEFIRHDTGWSWGSVFFDADNDGDDDLYVVNGFTDYFTFTQYRRSPTYPDELYAINNGREPNWFFRNDDGLPIVHVPDTGTELPGINSRGVAPLDFDGDGDVDLAVTTFHSRLRLFRNDGVPTANRWLGIDLVGNPEAAGNRDAIGSQVIVRGRNGLYAWRVRCGGEGYLSMGSPELQVGLGSESLVDLEVRWPGGQRQTFAGIAANSRIRLRQGEPQVEVLAPR